MKGFASSIFNEEELVSMRILTEDANQDGMLSPELLQIVYAQNWFNIYVPRQMGGLELPLPDAIGLLEQLSFVDGSLGWTVTLCSGANLFVGFLPPETQALFFNDKQVCLAGSGMANGIAEQIDDGYIVCGKWNYATGAPHATGFTANCYIYRNGHKVVENNQPCIKSFLFKRSEVVIFQRWHGMGMRATASHSFSVNNLRVPDNRSFVIDPGYANIKAPLFHFPFIVFAEVTLAVNFLGMAFHWITACRQKFTAQGNSSALQLLTQTNAALEKIRTLFYEELFRVWSKGVNLLRWSEIDTATLSRYSHQLVHSSLKAVEQLYPLCGMEAATYGSELNRIWLDIHTAAQHSLFRRNIS